MDYIGLNYQDLPVPKWVLNISESTNRALIKELYLDAWPQFTADIESDLGYALHEVITHTLTRLDVRMNYNMQQAYPQYAVGTNQDAEAAIFGLKRQIAEVITNDDGSETVIYEDDETFRRRRMLAPEALTTAGTGGAYLYFIYSAFEKPVKVSFDTSAEGKLVATYDLPKGGFAAKIKHADIRTPAPGVAEYSFIIHTKPGVPSQELADLIYNNLMQGNARPRPLCDKVVYTAPTALEYDLELTVHLKDGALGEIIEPIIRERMDAYTEACRILGGLVDKAGIMAAARIEGVYDVDCDFEDLQADWAQFPLCTDLTINFMDASYHRPAWMDDWKAGDNG